MCNLLVTIRINNRPYSYASALTIFQACLEKKIFVPRFCYHVALKIAGNCRMCLLEEKSSLKPIASCAVTIGAGMAVYTQTELVKKAREGVLEYLLANHPLDCPICDQGGECDLQDQTMVFGADRGRFYEAKRSTPNKNLGYLIKTFLNRCIHCARCTRFLADVAGVEALSLLGRGYKTEISNYMPAFITSEISGNIIDLCPVGALTSKPYAFKARPWELVSVYTFDILEPFGAALELNYRGLELMRILPRINYEINAEWVSDRTRFYYDAFSLQRLVEPYLLRDGFYSLISWANGLKFWKNCFIAEGCSLLNELFFGVQQVLSTGDFADLEVQTVKSFFGARYSGPFAFSKNKDSRDWYCANIASRQLLFTKNSVCPKKILLVGVNPRFESPVLNIKLRKLVVEEFAAAFLVGFCSNLNYPYLHLAYGVQELKFFFENVLNSEEDELLIVARPTSYNYQNFSVYRIWNNIGKLTEAEIFARKDISAWSSFVEVFCGQSEIGFYNCQKTNFSVNMLHHMEAETWGAQETNKNALLLPTKFYLEKFSSYLSESAFFFSTATNIFGYGIRGTKEDWKILLAVLEFAKERILSIREEIMLLNAIDFGRFEVFNLVTKTVTVSENKNCIWTSRVNDYYRKTVLDRISPVLTLCAKSYSVINGYKFLFQ